MRPLPGRSGRLSNGVRGRAALLTGFALAALALPGGVDGARAPLVVPPQVPAAERARLAEIVDRAVVSTRVEAAPYGARPDVFEFLLDHPEFATHVTRALRIARYRIWRTPEGLFLDDGWGAKGHFAVVHAAPGSRVMHARGRFEHPLLPDIHGQAVVVLEYGFRAGPDGRPLVATTVSGYVTLESRLLSVLGRLVGPLAQAKADKEARQLLKVFARVSRAIEEEPGAVLAQVSQRREVPPRDLEEFRRLLEGAGGSGEHRGA